MSAPNAAAAERILVRLPDARPYRGGWRAKCPAHDGQSNNSLALRQIEGQALLHCFGGCAVADVLATMELTTADLYDEPRKGASYDYRDALGGLTRTVHRTPNKRFRQSGDTHSRPQLYRLPEVVTAVGKGVPVFITEGEKDVHAVESLGAVATTSPMGASNWPKVDTSPLAGAHVVVVPDNDDAGQSYLRDVLVSLEGVAASVTVKRAKVGKDAADHVAAGLGLDDLVDVQERTPVDGLTGPTLVSLSGVSAERVSWLWPGRLPAGKLVVLDGDPAVGKSTLAVELAARISTGTRWPDGADCPSGSVILLSAEDGLADTIRPRLDAAGSDPTRVHALTEIRYVDDDGKCRTRSVTLADARLIEQAVVKVGATLVVVDVLMAYLPGKVDSHRDQDIRSVLSELAALAERTGCCILLLRHLNKATGGNPLYRGGGSIGIVGAARAAMLAATDPDDDNRRVLAVTKSNLAAMPSALGYRLVDSPEHGCARVEWLGATDHQAGDLLGRQEADDDRTERDEAAEWLVGYITERGGEVKAGDAIKAAGQDGIAKTTLTRARQRAGIVTDKAGLKGGWLWRLAPRRIHEETEGTTSHGLGSSVPSVDSSGVGRGPCARCGDPCQRYGDGARTLCAPCTGRNGVVS